MKTILIFILSFLTICFSQDSLNNRKLCKKWTQIGSKPIDKPYRALLIKNYNVLNFKETGDYENKVAGSTVIGKWELVKDSVDLILKINHFEMIGVGSQTTRGQEIKYTVERLSVDTLILTDKYLKNGKITKTDLYFIPSLE